MKKNTEYIIPYEGLKGGSHQFSFEITDSFFKWFEAEQSFREVNIQMEVFLMKDTTMLIFDFKHEGTIVTNCDRCLAEIPQPLSATNKLIVKFGDSTAEDDETLVTLPRGEYEIDLAPYIYDYILLSVPWKIDCSELKEDEKNCDEEMLTKINALEAKPENDNEHNPIWEELKKLK